MKISKCVSISVLGMFIGIGVVGGSGTYAEDCFDRNLEQCKIPSEGSSKAQSSADSGKFVPVYTDRSNGLSWSRALPKKYSNGCVDSKGDYDISKCNSVRGFDGKLHVVVEESYAAMACRDIGARLPSLQEFESLLRKFDHIEKFWGPKLTTKGIADMEAIFDDGVQNWFWTSTVWGPGAFLAEGWPGEHKKVTEFRSLDYAVRCVSLR